MGKSLLVFNINNYNSDHWKITPDENSKLKGANELTFKCSSEHFASILFKFKFKDSKTLPASSKGISYKEMVDEILNNSNNKFYAWADTYLKLQSMVHNLTIKDKAVKIAKDIFGNKYILEKEFIKDIYQNILHYDNFKENGMKIKKSLFVRYLESNKDIDKFIEDVIDGSEILPDLDNTSGVQNPDVSVQTSDEYLIQDDTAHLTGDTVNTDISTGDNGGSSIDPVLAENNAGDNIEISVQDTEEDEIITDMITGFTEDFNVNPELSTQPDNNVPKPENQTPDAKAIDSGEETPKDVDGTGDDGGMSKNDPEEPKLKEEMNDNIPMDNNEEWLGLDVYDTNDVGAEDMWEDDAKVAALY